MVICIDNIAPPRRSSVPDEGVIVVPIEGTAVCHRVNSLTCGGEFLHSIELLRLGDGYETATLGLFFLTYCILADHTSIKTCILGHF